MTSNGHNERVVLNPRIQPTHYDLELCPDLDALTFTCNESIKLAISEANLTSITLHSKEIHIDEASLTCTGGASAEAPMAVETISYNRKMTTVTLTFAAAFPTGEAVLSIKYQGILNGDMAGFYRSSYSDADGKKKIMASTQFESLDARRAFVCVDEPAVKATFSVAIVLPASLTALSNMPEKSATHLPARKGVAYKKVCFDVSPKMSTYLLAWAVGEFDHVSGVTKGGVALRVFSPPGRAAQGAFALDAGIRALDFYDDFFKVPYPLPKMDMICITEFAMGAMENWGLVTYRESALMIDDEKASVQQKQRVAIVVAHELAHQWFGNLVTMSWWDGLWLNEGFAAFMEHFCVDALYPEYKIWEQYTTDAFGAAQRLDSLRTSHPIIVPIKHAEEVEQVFDAISYCKGSTVVNMVCAVLGKDKFREGLQLYMRRHAYGNTETADLWNAWTQVSGIDVAALMHTWTTRMGYPYLKVVAEKWGPSSVEVTLQQAWFLADGSAGEAQPGQEEPVWRVPLLVASSTCVSEKAVIMEHKMQSFTVPLAGEGDWLKINAGQQALVRVAHSEEMARRLQPAIRNKTLSPVDRAALLNDAYALAKAGTGSVESVVDILRAMDLEDANIVWSVMQGVLMGLYVQLEEIGGPPFVAFKAFGRRAVLNALGRVGWDARPEDDHSAKLLRSTVIGLLDTFAHDEPTVAAEARRRFDLHFTNPSVLPGEYKTTVYRIVLMNGGEEEYERVKATYYATEDNVERKYAMNSLGAARLPHLKLATLDWAIKSGDVKLQDCFYPLGAVSSSSKEGCALAWQYYQDNFAHIKNMLAKASSSLMDATIVYSTNRFCTHARANEIEAFFGPTANPLPSSARRISQSVEMIRSAATMVERVKQSRMMQAGYW